MQVAQSEKLVTVEETTIAVKKILDDDSEGEFTVRCNRETCIAFARTTTSVLRMVWHEHAEVRPCMHTRCSLPTHTFTLTSPPPPYALALAHPRTHTRILVVDVYIKFEEPAQASLARAWPGSCPRASRRVQRKPPGSKRQYQAVEVDFRAERE